jgi:hypothetical protein
MALTKKDLHRLQESMHHWFTARQEQIILETFSSEPDDYALTEQDIAEQIRKIIRDNP